ncbi:MAG TPA: DUF4232 domain-containing protein [Microbacterium sp.]|nr:DUF4232 domain-containing protein [Microbacterium sp.]
MTRFRSPGSVAGLAVSALWLLTGGLYMVIVNDRLLYRMTGVLGIGPLQAQYWLWPLGWAVPTLLLSAVILTTVTALFVDQFAPRGNAFLIVWFSVIASSAVLGLTIDVTHVIDVVAQSGVSGLGIASLESATRASFWGLMIGWMPALIVFTPYRPRPSDGRAMAALAAATVAIVLFAFVSGAGYRAYQAQVAMENEAMQGHTDESGAFIDPQATGEPVPTAAPGATLPELDPAWCTPDRSMLLLGASDAATGHRGQIISLSNFSEEPCVIEGYPDIAFEDQNGHALDVAVAPGSGFMATDPGPSLITVPAHGQAITFITWDANSTAGALVARKLHAAATPGMERGSWPVELDIVGGSSVEITAWSLDSQGVTTP